MTAAAPSRGDARGHVPGVTAPEAKRLQDARRVRRYRDRKAKGQAVGRFLVTEDLVTALIIAGAITECEAATIKGIEQGIATVLANFTGDHFA